jgi:hypothetical protein
MLFNQARDRFGNKSRWIAGISLLAVVGAVCIFARPAKSHFTAPSARPAEKGSPLNARLSKQLVSPDDQARIASSFGNLPLSFEPNLGQTDPQVKFLSRNPHYNLFLTSNEAVFTLPIAQREKTQRVPRREKPRPISQAVLRMKILGSSATPEVAGDTKIAGHSNYLIGRDASKWVHDVDQYARVNYRGVYPGIDLTFYGQQRQLEFDFIVKPNADAKNIALGIEGAKKMATDGSGDLVLTSGAGDLRLHKPVAYQLLGDARQPVDARFVIKGTEVAFAVGEYDHSRELVIDPSFLYSTYLGAGAEDDGYAIAVDSTGAAYVTGQTSSPGFPKANPLPAPNNALQGPTDAFVTKFSADGTTLVYSTYLGGTGTDSANAIALDSSLQAYVTGSTDSTDFPAAGNPQPTLGGGIDAFIAELSAAGNSLVYATYIGGTADEIGYGIAVDSTGIYVVGSTSSNDFGPLANASQGSFQGGTGTNPTDGFVVKINPATGSAIYGSYLGGSGNDIATGVAVDAAHIIYVTGVTLSTDFPVAGVAANYPNSLQCGTDGTCNGGKDDSFVTAIAFSGVVPSYVYSHYLGGSSFDDANQIVVDSTSNAYVVGITSSTDFPTTASAYQRTLTSGASNAFVTKLNAAGTTLGFSTYVGGSGTDNALNVALDGSKNVYITGSTTSTNFPTTASAPQKTLGGDKDAFVTELKADGTSLIFSTYLGGSKEENHFLAGIAVDPSNNVYVTGDTLSPDFPVTANAHQPKYTSACGAAGPCRDVFVVKISPLDPGFTVSVGAIAPAAISKGSTGTSTVTVTSAGATAGTVALGCNITTTAAKPPTCSVSPNSVALTAGGNQTSTLTITTTSTGSTSIVTTGMWLPLPGLALLGAGLVRNPNRKRKILLGIFGTIALAGLLLMAGCGSGNGGGGGGGGGGGTTAGSYTVNVTGTITNKGTASGSANFSVQ